MLCKIAIADLAVGMYVVDSGLPWLEHPFLYNQEGLIGSQRELAGIQKAGYLEVFVDTEKGHAPGTLCAEEETDQTDHTLPQRTGALTALEEELEVAQVVYHDCLLIARDILRDVQSGGEIDVRSCSFMVDAIIGSAVRNPDALLTLCKLRHHDAYTFTHGVNVSVMAAAFGVYLGLPPDDLKELGLAGLFHDVGKARIPDAILNKPTSLTHAEFAWIMRHPALGCDLLRGLKLPQGVTRGVGEHHERFDGSGYPHGLAGDAIHPWGRILALADVYDAMTSRRCYKGPMLPTRALAVIHGMRGNNFPAQLAERFIKFMGPYPVGSFVQLSNGEYGFVRTSNPHRPLFPEILVAFDPEMQPLTPCRLLDLRGDDSLGTTVTKSLDPLACGIDPVPFFVHAHA